MNNGLSKKWKTTENPAGPSGYMKSGTFRDVSFAGLPKEFIDKADAYCIQYSLNRSDYIEDVCSGEDSLLFRQTLPPGRNKKLYIDVMHPRNDKEFDDPNWRKKSGNFMDVSFAGLPEDFIVRADAHCAEHSINRSDYVFDALCIEDRELLLRELTPIRLEAVVEQAIENRYHRDLHDPWPEWFEKPSKFWWSPGF